MTAETFYRQVLVEAGGPALDDARRVTGAVFHAIRDRLTREEAEQAAAQLPRPLKLLWWRGELEDSRPVKMHRRQSYARVQREGELASEREARRATYAVFAALKQQLSPGETDDILAQLPKDLKIVWEGA